MNDRDIDLVLAFVAGELTGDDASAFEARLVVDPDLAAEVEGQRWAIVAVAATRPVSLSPAERSRMRSAVAEALSLHESPAATAMPRRRSWRAGLAAVAGAAAVLVAAFVVVPAMFGGTGDGAEEPTALREAATTTAAAEDQAVAESADDGGASMTTTLAGAEAPPMVPMVEDDYDLSRLADDPDELLFEADGAMVAIDLEQIEGCFDALGSELPGTSDHVVVAATEGDEGGQLLYLTYRNADGSIGAAAVDGVTCRVVETTEVGSGEGSG